MKYAETKQHDPSTLRGHALAIALLSAGAQFMENLDGTIIATGLPSMARDFHTSAVAVNVGITSYLLTLAIFIPLSGWMAARFGERRVFASAILIFTVASALCGLARTLPLFTAARVLEGIGGSMMVPVGRLMVVRASTKAQLMKAIAYTIWPALVGPLVGPPIGGLILSVASWPWMFLLNIPIGIVLFALALKIVRNDDTKAKEPFDAIGFLLVAATSFCLVYLLELLQSPGVSRNTVLLFALAIAVFVVGALHHLRTAANPLFRLEVFRIETFRTAMLSGSLFRMSVFSVPFLLPLLFQVGFGLNPLASGSLTMAVFAGNLAMKPVTTPLLRRFGFRQVLLVNGAATVVLLAACGWLRADTSRVVVLLVLFLGGLGRSMELTSLTTMSFSDLPEHLKGNGTTLATTMQQMTTSLGVAVAALTLHSVAALHGHSSAADFRVAFCVMAAFAAAALPSFARLHPDAGAAVSGAATRAIVSRESA
ncbi:MAG: DHA2 family efflux MFS transporter permease subunit [Janthinobacterium lividum]